MKHLTKEGNHPLLIFSYSPTHMELQEVFKGDLKLQNIFTMENLLALIF